MSGRRQGAPTTTARVSRRTLLGLGVGAAGVAGVLGWGSLRPGPPAPGVPAPRRRPADWTYEPVGGGPFSGSMSLRDGTLYLASDAAPRVEAVDTRAGRRRWSVDLPGAGRDDLGAGVGQVVAAGGVCFVAVPGGRVHALDSRAGGRQWTSEALGGAVPGKSAVFGSTVCVGLEPEYARHGDDSYVVEPGVLCGLDLSSGRVRWRAENSRLLHADHSRGLLVAATRGGTRLAVLDAHSGRPRWTLPQTDAGPVGIRSALGRTHLYVTLTGRETTVLAHDLESGERHWKAGGPPVDQRGEPSAALSLAPDERTLYVCDTGTGGLSAHHADTGHQRWHTTTDAPTAHRVLASPQTVYVATGDAYRSARNLDYERTKPDGVPGLFSESEPIPGGYVTACSASSGERLWRTVRDDACTSAPVQAGGSILVSHPEEVWAYDDRTGTPRWRTTGATTTGPDPLTGGGRLYVATASGIRSVLI